MKDLSIIIPSRNEIFLGKTIKNLLENITGNTEIIAILDGYTVPIPEIPQDPRVKIIGHTESIGQRAACNEAARLSQSKYLIKTDAHCAFKKGFDTVLMNDMQDNWTQVPTMRNLWAFDWKCPEGHTRYQGPSGPCTVCGKETVMDMKWIAKESPQSNSYCFDAEPHFQYFREFNKRLEGQGELTETMSLQGSFFMVTRDKWFELNLCDESFGSWGSQGIEVACKTWLSGGRCIVNHKTYYAHCFRTQGGDFSFPYPITGSQVGHAKKTARDLFFNNKWEKQIYPLYWLVEKFWPIPGWDKENLDRLKKVNPPSNFSTLVTSSASSDRMGSTKPMTSDTKNLVFIGGGGSSTSQDVIPGQSKNEVGGITTIGDTTDMVKDGNIVSLTRGNGGNKPSINEPVNIDSLVMKTGIPIPIGVSTTSPQPTTSSLVKPNSSENLGSLIGTDAINNKHTHVSIISSNSKNVKGIIYYTDNRLDEKIMKACQEQIKKSVNGAEIVSCSLKPIEFGKNIVLNLERSTLTMFKQILAALEASTADIIYFCEHDVLYDKSHFDFVPSRDDTFYYNSNNWFLRLSDGHCLYYANTPLSSLCAYRTSLITHFRERLAMIEDIGFSRNIGFEPFQHGRIKWKTWYRFERWQSEKPNIDIRHDKNQIRSRWTKEEFRRVPKIWVESNEIPGWDLRQVLNIGN